MRSLISHLLASLLIAMHGFSFASDADSNDKNAISLQGDLGPVHQAKIYRDANQSLDFEKVRQLPKDKWQDLKGSIAEGFTASAIWVHFQLPHSHADESGEWFLELSQPLLKDVRLYAIEPNGKVTERFGTALSDHKKRELNYRNPTFVLKEQQEGVREYWLRVATPTALQTSFTLYKANKLMSKHAKNDFIWGVVFGTYFIIVIFYFVFSFWARERLHLFYTSYIFVNFLAALFTSGWPLQYLEAMNSSDNIKYLGIWVSLSLTTGTLMSSEFLQMQHRLPRLQKLVILAAVSFTVFGIYGVIDNNYNVVVPYVQVASLFLIVFFMMLAIYGALQGDRISRIFLFAFSLFYIGVTWRYMRNFGLLEPNFWSDNSYQLGAFSHMLIMSAAIFTRYNTLLKEKKEAQLQLQYESKIRTSQGKFVDMVSHEFRTPLSVVRAALGNLMAKHKQDTETVERLNRIERASERMQTLIHNYLNTERTILNAHSPNFGTHNIASICRIALEDLIEEHRQQIFHDISIAPDVRCDIDLIRIAIHNLLSNACKHSMSLEPIVLSTSISGNYVCIQISDTGKGIEKEDIDHLFDRHYRGNQSNPTEGSGLGLYIVQSIAISHHGRVSVRNNQPKGSVFTLELPL